MPGSSFSPFPNLQYSCLDVVFYGDKIQIMENSNKEKLSTEKRKFPRLRIDTNVEYSIVGKESLQNVNSTKNISAGGICIIVYENIEIAAVLSLKIYLPANNIPIHTKGRVAWKSEFKIGSDSKSCYDVGIEFLDINEDDRRKIFQYVFKALQRVNLQ